MEQNGNGFMWNLVIFEDYNKHCYLEGCYERFRDADKKGHKICDKKSLRYRVFSEMEFIQFKNPYYPD